MRGAGIEPADLQKLAEQLLEPIQLVMQQFTAAPQLRRHVVTLFEDDVGGHAHGGKRRTQLVGHIRDEALLQPGEILQLPDLGLQGRGHVVERQGEGCQIVLTTYRQSLFEMPCPKQLRGPRRLPYGQDDVTGDQQHDQCEQPDEQDAGQPRRGANQIQSALQFAVREQVVDLVGHIGTERQESPTTRPGWSGEST